MNSKLFYKKRNVGPSRELKDQAAMATKASKARALPKFWVSICSYQKQLVKEIWE